jgi:microcystin-dependent protein
MPTPLKGYDRVMVVTATTGTGAVTFGAAVTGFRPFTGVVANAATVRYLIEDDGVSGAWELGSGAFTDSSNSMTRTLIASSTGALLNLSGNARVSIIASALDTDPVLLLPPGLGPIPWAGATAPAGWLLCYGQNVSRTTYALLFAALSTQYGPGDGSTTFGIPDMRGRVSVGKGDMGGVDGGRFSVITLGGTLGAETLVIASGNLPKHTHGVNINSGTESADHSHAFNVNSGNISADHVHTPDAPGTSPQFWAMVNASPTRAVGTGSNNTASTGVTNGASANHYHNVAGSTGGRSAAHTHNVNGNTADGGFANTAISLVQPSQVHNHIIYAGV